mgnify:CR=1 FL=1
MKKLESKIQGEIIKYIKELPNLYYEKSIITNKRGSPDIKICYKGKFIALEVKSANGKISELQDYTLNKIRDAGGISEVVRSAEDVIKILSKI